MQGVIHLLPDAVANQIAAGEVIQRPASVIKELVENSIDAGATSVKVVVKDAGRTLIQVIDNGCGMTETDARLAFERHATSKISDVTDLYKLHTMGFRGEALASIAAVAQVELTTRRPSDELGVRIEISGSRVTNQELVSAAVGSQFNVKNLFFNIPARRAFLKSDAAEMRHVVQEFLRVALAHPDVAMSLVSNGTPLYTLMQGNMKQRVSAVAGRALSQELLPIEVETDIVNIKGFVGTPTTGRKTSTDQYFFANDRYMRSAYFNKAVIDAYKNIISPDLSPAYYIYMTVDAKSIDVNVHPQKTEIKFEEETAIWQILNAAVRECLGKYNIMPSLDFDTADPINIPTYIPGRQVDPESVSSLHPGGGMIYNPFEHEGESSSGIEAGNVVSRMGQGQTSSSSMYTSRMAGGYQPQRQEVTGWEQLYSHLKESTVEHEIKEEPTDIKEQMLFDISQVETVAEQGNLYQFRNRYIVMPVKNGLMFVDQHRAHERIQYEAIKRMVTAKRNHSQKLIFPEYVTISAEDACIIEEMSAELDRAGMEMSYDSEKGQLSFTAIPSQIGASEIGNFVETLIYDVRNGETDVESNIMEYIIKTLSSKSAMAYGKQLSGEEMASICSRLFACDSPSISPSGKRIFVIISNDDIDSRF